MAVNLDELPLPDELPVIPDGWRYESLADLVEERGVSYGIVQPGSETSDGVPIVRVNNIRNGRIDTKDMLKVTADIEAKFQRSRLRGGEVLLTLVGTLGEVAIVPDNLRGWNVARAVGVIPVRKDPGSLWVSICLRSAFIQHCIRTWATTTVQATFNLRDLAKLPIPIPPTATREAIAAVLGALDDKIELNRRMNATLEAMARALFQSWFVDFLPVRANMDRSTQTGDPVRAKLDLPARSAQAGGRPPSALDPATAALFPEHLEGSPLGHIPKGWTARRLPDAIEVNPRRTLKGGTIAPYLDMKNLPTQGHSAEEVIDREFSSGTKFQNGDTLLARITPCLENGKTGYVDFLEDGQVGWGSTEYIVLAPKPPLPPQFGYLLARSDALRTHAIQNMTGTSGRQRVPAECLNTFWLAVPPPEIARRFEELTAPLMAKIKANSTQSRTLATLRDTLLPKLLSGALDVAELNQVQ
ncbi:MAG: restriction endonuclease subunit S [Lysobacterales bacterium CG02_land_8_20_14_3_00_62_12]|nr:MAG: restriction endonuclease subunit S [Xanthomonadales bacterium CG02_land_8_20_14_3_00_62_12]